MRTLLGEFVKNATLDSVGRTTLHLILQHKEAITGIMGHTTQ